MNSTIRLLSIAVTFAALAGLSHADSITYGTTTVDKWIDPNNTTLGTKSVVVNSQTVTFDFESAMAGLLYGPTEALTFSFEPVPGQIYTFRVSRPGSFFTVTDLSPYGVPAEWGSRSLDPFVDYLNPAPFRFEVLALPFGMAVMQSTVALGDFGPSDDDYITGEVNGVLDNKDTPGFSTTYLGSLARASGAPLPPPGEPLFATSGTAGAIDEFGVKNHTVFWDNFSIVVVAADDLPDTLVAPAFTWTSENFIPGYIPGATLPSQPVPEPGSLALMLGGVAVVVLSRRRRR